MILYLNLRGKTWRKEGGSITRRMDPVRNGKKSPRKRIDREGSLFLYLHYLKGKEDMSG